MNKKQLQELLGLEEENESGFDSDQFIKNLHAQAHIIIRLLNKNQIDTAADEVDEIHKIAIVESFKPNLTTDNLFNIWFFAVKTLTFLIKHTENNDPNPPRPYMEKLESTKRLCELKMEFFAC